MPILLMLVIGLLFSIISLKYFLIPYILIGGCWLSLFIILTLISKSTVIRSIWFNFAFIVFLLGALEVYSYYSLNTTKYETSYSEGYRQSNDL